LGEQIKKNVGGRGGVANMGDRRGGYRNFVWETKTKETTSNNLVQMAVTKVDLQEDQYSDKRRTAVETALNIQFPQNAGNFLAS